MKVRIGCKVNLFLRITGVRENGYHDLESLFYPVPEPYDEIVFKRRNDGGGPILLCENPELLGEGNTMAKAWRDFAEATGFLPDFDITLYKNIPMGAGLGGGSADAAAVLLVLNEEAGNKALSDVELMELAAGVGADVPFFLMNTPAWAEGIGELLTPLHLDLSGFHFVLACPDVHVSTGWAYKSWDSLHLEKKAGATLTKSGSTVKNTISTCLELWNSFEEVVFSEHPELARIKHDFLSMGAAGAVMSGSGSSVCALFRREAAAKSAVDFFERQGIVSFKHAL
jgi:4-diphosphocytidyl-2-C-methyl-D-erythritol kinase